MRMNSWNFVLELDIHLSTQREEQRSLRTLKHWLTDDISLNLEYCNLKQKSLMAIFRKWGAGILSQLMLAYSKVQ